MTIRILENPNVPRGLEQMYAFEAVKVAQDRAKREAERREAETQRRKQIEENLEAIKAESAKRKEQEEERQRKLAAERFEAALREQFLTRNPGATDADWSRNRRSIIDEVMKARALGSRSPVADLVAKKRASGLYGNL